MQARHSTAVIILSEALLTGFQSRQVCFRVLLTRFDIILSELRNPIIRSVVYEFTAWKF